MTERDPPSGGLGLRTWFLRLFLASIALNAILGIWALLASDFGQTQGKVLATSFLASGAMLGLLVNGAPLAARAMWPVPVVAAGATVASFVLFTGLLWAEADTEAGIKIAASLLTIGLGATLVGLLELVELKAEHLPLRLADHGLIAVLCLTIVAVLWAEPDASWVARVIGIESVLVAALTVAIPVLSRFTGSGQPSADPWSGAGFCPACGERLDQPNQRNRPATCSNCGLCFTVSVLSPQGGPVTARNEPTKP